ncbi:MAG: hypothetical protein VCA35_09495, partial [Roseibacillus sp.]
MAQRLLFNPSRSRLALPLGLLTALLVTTTTGAFSSPEAKEWEPGKSHVLIVSVLEWKRGLSPFPKRNRKDEELRELLIKRG